jgi:hypothetical protein
MTDRQARNQAGGEPAPLDRSQSDDSKFQVSETARLQAEAQQRINAGRHDTIGSAP